MHIFKPLNEESRCRSDSDGVRRKREKSSTASVCPALEVTDNIQNEMKGRVLQPASGKPVPVVTAAPCGRFKENEGSPCTYPERGNRRSRSRRDAGHRM
ncbi:hypothetical protein PoB_006487000 [Plakobranchus ocellatus]|uniref:Uncharacterized protein n=1 Tax=Plakobranchus ocellatus TaxID=259542 RepID=A0AAV4D2M0_9GAST|nr:hypothetical protein PoB_006487000 [Plakobranchus ocellatus]